MLPLPKTVDEAKEYLNELARQDFFRFRKQINKDLKVGWWQRRICQELQTFYVQLVNGQRPKLIIQSPPQHGKSTIIIDFIAWCAGNNPDIRTIFASFSDRLGVRANKALQRIYDSTRYREIFPSTMINSANTVTKSGQALRNSEIIEYIDREGYFRNTTVQGSVTGESLDLGVIDDPIKGRAEANSKVIRDRAWDWFTDDFSTRFSEEAGLLFILTRWHVDDPAGRLISSDPSVKVLSYAAIATTDEQNRKTGEALFPELKSLEFLQARKESMTPASWESLYQQSPYILEGGIWKESWWQYWRTLPNLRSRIIYGDTAQKTKEFNDWSVFQCWGISVDRKIYLIDQLRGRYESPELIVNARAFWNKHLNTSIPNAGILSAFKVEDKVSGTGLIQTLKREGIPMIGIPREVDKVTRANDCTPLVESGNVFLPEDAPWLSDYLSEFAAFPNGEFDDQVDPTMDAIADILSGSMINYADIL